MRNAVHYAKKYSRSELINYSNSVLSVYLIAVNENIDFLKKTLWKEYSYLKKIIDSNEYTTGIKKYVDVVGQQTDVSKKYNSLSNIDDTYFYDSVLASHFEQLVEDDEIHDVSFESNRKIDTILNLSFQIERFILIGEPGSGKTTSLKKIFFENAIGYLNNNPERKFPILIKGSEYSRTQNMYNLIKSQIKEIEFEKLITKHRILILIDGINEIEESQKKYATKELINLLEKYKNINFIISTRKYGFYNDFGFPVFELKEFENDQIKLLVNKSLQSDKAEKLWTQIIFNNSLNELSRSPLLLSMIIYVSNKNIDIPKNKGLLFKLFVDAIFARERKTSEINIETKKDVLVHLAFWMRKNGFFKNVKKATAKQIISDKLILLNSKIDVNLILNELIDNNFIFESKDDIEFSHESQQEYFVAVEIQNKYFNTGSVDLNIITETWVEPLSICCELFNIENERNNFYHDLFIGKKNSIPKKLTEFNSTDISSSLHIGCRIAYNLRYSNEDLYSLSERYMNNIIVIWKKQLLKNIYLFPFEMLVKSVASLSSEKNFQKNSFLILIIWR